MKYWLANTIKQLWLHVKQVFYSLPKPQQATATVLKQLETALLLVLPETANRFLPSEAAAHTAVRTSDFPAATHAEEMAMQRLTLSYLLLLGRMADNYQLEKAAFLKQLLESQGALAGQDADEAAPHSPASPGVIQTAKRPKTGTSPHAESVADALCTAYEAAALCGCMLTFTWYCIQQQCPVQIQGTLPLRDKGSVSLLKVEKLVHAVPAL